MTYWIENVDKVYESAERIADAAYAVYKRIGHMIKSGEIEINGPLELAIMSMITTEVNVRWRMDRKQEKNNEI